MSYQSKIIDHYKTLWKNDPAFYLWDKGPIERLPFDFRVLEFAPNYKRNMWTYGTCCMSDPTSSSPIELHLFSPQKDPYLIELLTSITYYHQNTAIGRHDTIYFGRPWLSNSLCEFGYVSLPYIDGPELNQTSKFYWLIPITRNVRDYKAKYGFEQLERKFDEGFDYLNPHRLSCVN